MTYRQIMGNSTTTFMHVQSYISPKELKALDKKANEALRSRSDMIRLILNDVLLENI